MCNSGILGRRAFRPAGWWLCAMLAAAWAIAPSRAPASCLVSADPAIRELQALVNQNAAKALKQVQAQLEPLEHSAKADAKQLAALYAVQARAYSILELDDAAKNAASKGLKLATLAADPVRLDLLSTYAENAYASADIDSALKSIDAAQAAQVRGSIADTCLLITRGLLQNRQDRPDLAIATLTQPITPARRPTFRGRGFFPPRG